MRGYNRIVPREIAILAIPPIAYVSVFDVNAWVDTLIVLRYRQVALTWIFDSSSAIENRSKEINRAKLVARRVCASPSVSPYDCIKRSVLDPADSSHRKIISLETLFGVFAIAGKRRRLWSAARLIVERRRANNFKVDTVAAIVIEGNSRYGVTFDFKRVWFVNIENELPTLKAFGRGANINIGIGKRDFLRYVLDGIVCLVPKHPDGFGVSIRPRWHLRWIVTKVRIVLRLFRSAIKPLAASELIGKFGRIGKRRIDVATLNH
jgi:hypothetical protein